MGAIAKASRTNFLGLESELSSLRNEMALYQPTDEEYKVLSSRYENLWKIKTEVEKNRSDKKKIIAGIATPVIGLTAAWAGRELLQSAFWRDIAREVTKVKF